MPEELDELVDRWTQGWAAARRTTPARRGAWWEVDPASPDRRLELELALGDDADPAELEAAAAVVRAADDVWLTVFTTPGRRPPVPTGLVVERDQEVLMRCELGGPGGPGAVRPDPRVTVATEADRAVATVVVDAAPVAAGTAAVLGTDVVVDRVQTSPEHRRQGLGSAVMGALAAWAAEQGATRGLLGASRDGQALYRALGWDVVAAMTTFERER